MSNGFRLLCSTTTVPIIHTLKTLSRPSMDFFAPQWSQVLTARLLAFEKSLRDFPQHG